MRHFQICSLPSSLVSTLMNLNKPESLCGYWVRCSEQGTDEPNLVTGLILFVSDDASDNNKLTTRTKTRQNMNLHLLQVWSLFDYFWCYSFVSTSEHRIQVWYVSPIPCDVLSVVLTYGRLAHWVHLLVSGAFEFKTKVELLYQAERDLWV